MAIVSFLSDFGLKDNFVGVVKAVILKIDPSAKIIDISHQIPPHSILEAALILRSSFQFFPKNTIHLAIVDPGVGTTRKKIIVKTEDFYFVAPDNGLLSLVLKQQPPLKIIEITNKQYFLRPISSTFHGRDIFAPVAGYLSKGLAPERFGREIFSYKELSLPKIEIKKNSLEGRILYVDHFGNLITNIGEKEFKRFIKGKKFKIKIKDRWIDRISSSYQAGIENQPLAIIGSFGFLEIALREKNAARILGLGKNDKIKILVF
ncbi:MAG: S-adenosyl-l-methionine hydroxide adenosyltransferase family protein [Candidatus Omnitrophica bacterium]|nr:S-adenosyl-l-methionine hydroxide adenosyltransferase family protein [Candidatus Omnitrophota bacterium]